MTTERLLRKIDYIASHNKRMPKVLDEIDTVSKELEKIGDFSLRDSLEEKLTQACIK